MLRLTPSKGCTARALRDRASWRYASRFRLHLRSTCCARLAHACADPAAGSASSSQPSCSEGGRARVVL
eukprot:6212588-Pleurochrysis_carterae.AAC.1